MELSWLMQKLDLDGLSENPNILLLAAGTLLGLSFPLAKLASSAHIPASTWVMVNSLGACMALLPALYMSKQLAWPSKHQLRYLSVSGPLTFAGPNLLVFMVIPHVGAGYSGIMFALSPVFTALLARLLGIGILGRFHVLGILLGLSGAVGISLTRSIEAQQTPVFWLAVAMVIPLALAAGNIYRSVAWPKDSSPESLAFWSHTAAFMVYFSAAIIMGLGPLYRLVEYSPWLIVAQLLIAGLVAPLIYRLQRYGGPITLSQMGYVAASVNLVVVTVFFGEQYPIASWLSAVIIAIGIAVTIKANTATIGGQS